MKKIIMATLVAILSLTIAFSQDYTSPNTGLTLTLDDIASESPATLTISGNEYTLLGNLTIAQNDALVIDSDLTLLIDAEKLITIFGSFTIDSDSVTITALDESAPYDGFRFEEFSAIDIRNAIIQYGGGLRVLTETFSIDNSNLNNNTTGATTSAVISLSRGMPQITNNTIVDNELPAIGSAANSQVSAYIFNNVIQGNNKANGNRPQINMGTTLANQPLQIIQNTIIGNRTLEMTGGIALANFVGGSINAVIEGNTIKDNRFGIAILGPSTAVEITNNTIEDNNTQGDPMLGGSGINIYTTAAGAEVVASSNQIRGNLWGITLQDNGAINLGDGADNPGGNVFSENGNEGQVYALYNNTANPISAKNNCWIEGQQSTAQDVEDVIYHAVDNPDFGEVVFDPFECGVLGTEDTSVESFSFYPNPMKNEINFNNTYSFTQMDIYGPQGNRIVSKTIGEGYNNVPVQLPSGVYFITFSNDRSATVKKLVVQ